MNVAQQLYQLQENDLEIESGERSLRQITGQLGESEALIKARNKLASEQQHREELQHQQHTTEWEIDDLTSKIKPIEEKLYSGRIINTKELSNLQHELDSFKSHRGQLEDKALEIMEQVELAEASLAKAAEELEGTEAEWQKEQQKLSAEMEQVKASLTALRNDRQSLIDTIDPQAAGLYQQLKKQKVTAVARVEQGICTGCRISLSTATLQQARSGNLVQCTNCGRILYLA